MKVVVILGSPRKNGNSSILASEVAAPMEAAGAEISTFHLNGLNYRGCQACMACKTGQEQCVLDDDLRPVLEAFREADVSILASPVYYGDLSGQMKLFVDRTFALLVPDYITAENPSRLGQGKRCVIALSQGAPEEESFNDVFPRYRNFLDWYGFQEIHQVRACGVHASGSVRENEAAMKQARRVGEVLVSEH